MRSFLGRGFAFLYGIFALFAAIISALIVGVLAVLPFVVVPRGRRERFTIVGVAAWARFMSRLVLMARVEVHGEENLGVGDGALVIANHRSWMDPLILMGDFRAMAVSKAEIFYLPFVGLFAWLAGVVFFDRKSKKARAKARDEINMLLGAGRRIQLFPEGTRNPKGIPRERVFLRIPKDCYAAGLPILPVALVGTERVLPPHQIGAYLGQTVHIGRCEPVYPKDFPDAESFAQEAWRRVQTEVHRLEGRGEQLPGAGIEPALP